MSLSSDLPATASIRARLNYIVDTGAPPVSYVDWPEMEGKAVAGAYELKEMTISDGRPLIGRFVLDTHGFVFTPHDTKVADFTDEAERKRVYDPEIEALVRQYSGARDVIVFDHTIRIGDEATRKALNARPPVRGVHNDYTDRSAEQRLRDILGDAEAERRMRKRWGITQVWRPIRGDVLADPLAICDGRTIPKEGFITIQRRYRHRTAESFHISFNPSHVWFYLPRMTRREAIVFKVYDTSPTVTSKFTAHTAFDDPNTPAGAPARESIETRTFVFYD